MSKPHFHLFEGEQMTMAQIRALVPVLGEHSIRGHLAAGRNTRQAMLAVDPAAQRRNAGRLGRAAAEAAGKLPVITTHFAGARRRASASGFKTGSSKP